MAAISCKKRARMFDDGDAPMPMEPTCSPARMLVLESPSSKRSRMGQHAMDDEREGVGSPFQGGCDQADAAGSAAASDAMMRHTQQRLEPRSGEMMFSLEQVRDIVQRTVDERERVLREHYDRVLQQKLQEQWQSFAKFNEDYVSRSLKSSDLSYCS